MPSESARDRESGQGTVEWVALILVVSLAVAALAAAAGVGLPGASLAQAIAAKLACAAGLEDRCTTEAGELERVYGAQVAKLLDELAPTLRYEDGMRELPVDYRRCREDACSLAPGHGLVWRTDEGVPAVAFTHVVDCRRAERTEAECSGERAGRLYLQYWLYYPDSQTDPFGERGFHEDDWESLQVRLGERAEARASSHHSYNYRGGPGNWPSDTGLVTKSGWGPYAGDYHVSAGSHAGHVFDLELPSRYTPGDRLRLIPIESLSEADRGVSFEVIPPWLKGVYLDPESEKT